MHEEGDIVDTIHTFDDLCLEKLVVGLRQSLKLIENKEVLKAIVAKDTDSHILYPFVELCKKENIEITYVETKKELGKLCKLDVASAIAVIKK